MEFEKNKKADDGELHEDQEKIIDQDDGKGKQKKKKKKKQLGGIKTMPFIFGELSSSSVPSLFVYSHLPTCMLQQFCSFVPF